MVYALETCFWEDDAVSETNRFLPLSCSSVCLINETGPDPCDTTLALRIARTDVGNLQIRSRIFSTTIEYEPMPRPVVNEKNAERTTEQSNTVAVEQEAAEARGAADQALVRRQSMLPCTAVS